MWSREERTERITVMEQFSKGIVVFKTTMYLKKYGRQRLEKCWCAKECPKMPSINTLWLWKRKELSWDICLKRCRRCVRCMENFPIYSICLTFCFFLKKQEVATLILIEHSESHHFPDIPVSFFCCRLSFLNNFFTVLAFCHLHGSMCSHCILMRL